MGGSGGCIVVKSPVGTTAGSGISRASGIPVGREKGRERFPQVREGQQAAISGARTLTGGLRAHGVWGRAAPGPRVWEREGAPRHR